MDLMGGIHRVVECRVFCRRQQRLVFLRELAELASQSVCFVIGCRVSNDGFALGCRAQSFRPAEHIGDHQNIDKKQKKTGDYLSCFAGFVFSQSVILKTWFSTRTFKPFGQSEAFLFHKVLNADGVKQALAVNMMNSSPI